MLNNTLIAFLVGIGVTLITILGDTLIKQASLQSHFSGWKYLVLGAIIYGLTAFGWFFVMRKFKLSTLGVVYALTTIIVLTLVSVLYFNEKLSPVELVGIVLAIISLVILARFA